MLLTVEETVSDGTTRSNVRFVLSVHVVRTAVGVAQCTVRDAVSGQLLVVARLHVATVVLVEVAQTVVHVHWTLHATDECK